MRYDEMEQLKLDDAARREKQKTDASLLGELRAIRVLLNFLVFIAICGVCALVARVVAYSLVAMISKRCMARKYRGSPHPFSNGLHVH